MIGQINPGAAEKPEDYWPICPACGERAEKLEYCEWGGCYNKRCKNCLTEYFDPVMGVRDHVSTFMCCEECGEAIQGFFANEQEIKRLKNEIALLKSQLAVRRSA